MRDYKGADKDKKVRSNRSKKKPRQIDLRRVLRRGLYIGVGLFSVALAVAGIFFGVQLLLASDQFRIDSIRVEGNQRLSDETLTAWSDVRRGMSTFGLDLDLIGRKVEENPWVKQARIRRAFPDRVIIEVAERQPVAIINLGYLYYLDRDGDVFKVLESTDSLDFPVITGFDAEPLRQGHQRDREQLKLVVALLEELREREGFNLQRVSEIHRESAGGLSLYTLNEGVRIRMGLERFSEKLDRLERIYALLSPKMKLLDYIDLNVDDKVIVRIERS